MNVCRCGCGERVRRAEEYRRGHRRASGALKPYATQMHGPVIMRTHRIRATLALGKPLPEGVIVHHADGSLDADAPLVICQDNAYNRLLHIRLRAKQAGGNPNTDKFCCRCERLRSQAEFYPSSRPESVDGLDRCRGQCCRDEANAKHARKREQVIYG